MMTSDALQHAIYTLEAIEDLIVQEISERISLSKDHIDMSRPITEYGMDSVNLVRFAASMERRLGLSDLEPTLLNDYESLKEMAKQFAVMHFKIIKNEEKVGLKKLSVNVVASFTAEPIDESLNFWLHKVGYKSKIEFAPYNQVFQQLFDLNSQLYKDSDAIHVLFIRIEDWFRFEDNKLSYEKVRKTVDDLLNGLQMASDTTKAKFIVALCSHSPEMVRHLGLTTFLEELDQEILAFAEFTPNLYPLDLRYLNKQYDVLRLFDDARNKLGHIPFTQEYFVIMGAEVSRKIFCVLSPEYKVIVLDCDNTLWQGVCGEDGILGVQVTEPFRKLQQMILDLKNAGKLLAICSKNNEEDVKEVFARHPKMLLKLDDFVTHRINWERKSINIQSIAEELQLGLDSFIFIDDNPTECAEVTSSLVDVLAITLPPRVHDIPSYLSHFWALGHGKITEEDKKRTELYQQNRSREKFRRTANNYEDFLEQLQVVVAIKPLERDRITRAAQLTCRTNQFNATTIRYSEAELEQYLQSKIVEIYSVDVKDRFGDYGFVGLMIVKIERKYYRCESFMLSCRVLGKRVEHEMLRSLSHNAREKKLDFLMLDFIPSQKNKPIETFYKSLGRDFDVSQKPLMQLCFSLDEIESLLVSSKVEYEISNEKVSTHTDHTDKSFSILFAALHEIAAFKGKAAEMSKAVESLSKLSRPKLTTEFIAPRKTWEKQIASIWCDVLRMDKVGIYDNFYELGGDSLRAAEAFARMWDLGVPETVSLQTILDPTVAGLVQAIEDVKAGKTPTLLMNEFSLEDEGKVPNDIHNNGYVISDFDRPIENVFITGVTGYIGAFILSELFIQVNPKNIYCLVRAATETDGIDRIKSNLTRYGLWKAEYSSKLRIVLGELTEENFGLTEEEFKCLAKKIDTIFHSGAWVNFVYPYQNLKSSNVFSVETVMRLAIANSSTPIQLHFVSTLGVIMSTGYGRGNIVYENDPLAHCEGLLNGYEQSKYVGDKMIWEGIHKRGIPANAYRPGMVSGIGTTGEYHKLDEFLSSFLKGCIQLGSWPLVHTTWEIAPVDFVCKSIVHIAKNPKNIGKAYFALHPSSRPVKDFIKWHQDFGYPMRALPWDVWKRELLGQGLERLRNNALFPFVDFIRALSEKQVYFPPTDRSNFTNAIRDLPLECPDQMILLERYTKYFIDIGFYEPPCKRADYLIYQTQLSKYTPVTGVYDELIKDDVYV